MPPLINRHMLKDQSMLSSETKKKRTLQAILNQGKHPYVSAKSWCIMAENQILASKLDRS